METNKIMLTIYVRERIIFTTHWRKTSKKIYADETKSEFRAEPVTPSAYLVIA